MSITEKRMLGDYEVIHSLHIGDREIVVGDNPHAHKDERFLCVTCQYTDIFIKPEDAVVSDDYTEIIQEYGSRLAAQAEKIRPIVTKPMHEGIDTRMITGKDCKRIDNNTNLNNKIIVIKPTALRHEYQMCTNQIMLCIGGFGASPNSRGNACFCIDLYTGQKCRQERPNVMGILDRKKLPKWAEQTLIQYRQQQRAERGEAR